jgi:hypothetical protein
MFLSFVTYKCLRQLRTSDLGRRPWVRLRLENCFAAFLVASQARSLLRSSDSELRNTLVPSSLSILAQRETNSKGNLLNKRLAGPSSLERLINPRQLPAISVPINGWGIRGEAGVVKLEGVEGEEVDSDGMEDEQDDGADESDEEGASDINASDAALVILEVSQREH